ncbi:hypothetical protein ACA097_24910 [Pseudomonas sp. QL9]|uniref:hypothetical protein n=1 Tax=Pseudomonas sp. QL9 TaxID=3242725 RepID=UPI00352A7CAF
MTRTKTLASLGILMLMASGLWFLASLPSIPTIPLLGMENMLLKDGTQLSHQERMNFSHDHFVYTRTWDIDDNRAFFQISGKVLFDGRKHGSMTVDDRSTSNELHANANKFNQDTFFNLTQVLAKGSTLNIKILKSDDKGVCIYLYLARAVHCFGAIPD